MNLPDIYQKVIEDFKKTGSVKKAAENTGTSLVRAQKILITEGLWSSPASEKILELYNQNKTVKEIAKELFLSEKTVQAYLPYIRTGKSYGGDGRSADAIKSEDYRQRMQQAARSQLSSKKIQKELKEVSNKSPVNTSNMERSSSMETGYTKTADLYYGEYLPMHPDVLKLELSLDLSGLTQEDMEVLGKYGKVKSGITREILVPADITLHALHYVIMRAFGWQNSHLHNFQLPADVFQKITGGKNKPDRNGYVQHDGLYTDWAKLCGLYFRFPVEDFDDIYWDDDYQEGQSFKTWLGKKYTGPYRYNGKWEYYHNANSAAKSIIKENPTIRAHIPFSEWMELKDSGNEKELERTKNKAIPITEASIEDIQAGFESRMEELIERLPLIEVLFPSTVSVDIDLSKQVFELADKREASRTDIPVIPVTNELIHNYDYGDDWCVKIRMTDCYFISDSTGITYTDRKALSDYSACDMNNKEVDKALALKIATVCKKWRPMCLSLDGMSIRDDVGGVYGYVDFLKTIHDDEDEEKDSMKGWARMMGWTGRMNKPETLL